jgi:hypothetical protein
MRTALAAIIAPFALFAIAGICRIVWSYTGMPGGTLLGDMILEYLAFAVGTLLTLALAARIAGEKRRNRAASVSAVVCLVVVALSGVFGILSGYEYVGSRYAAIGGFIGGFLGVVSGSWGILRGRGYSADA